MELVKENTFINDKEIRDKTHSKKCIFTHDWSLKEKRIQEYYTNDCNYKYGLRIIEVKTCKKCNKEKIEIKQDKKFIFICDREEEKAKIREYPISRIK